jgi:hypothetical protein
MLKFKLNQLIATSIMVVALGSGSILAAGEGAAPLEVPKYRFQGKTVYSTLKSRADAGDEVARQVLENFEGVNMTTNLSLATAAAQAYNKKDVTSLPPGKQPIQSAAKSETPTTPTKEPSTAKSETSTIPTQDPCSGEVNKLQEEIKTLKAELAKAQHCPEAGGKVSSAQQKIYDELDQFLKSDPQLQYKKIKELIESLLAENDSESAITKFLGVVTKYQGEDARGEKINNIYIRINEEGVLKDYFLGMMRKELKVAQETVFPEGTKTLESLPPKPNLDFLVQNPLLMICYTDKDKAKGFWMNNLKTYNQFINSTKPEHLKAVYTFLIKKWKVLHALDVVSTTPMQAFLISIYERIESKKPADPRSLKMKNPQIKRFIEDRLKADLATDFKQLEADNMKYASEFNSANDPKEMSRNPFLKILEVKDFHAWSALGFERSAYDKMVSFLDYCNLKELKAILYHLSKLGFATQGDLNEQYFYKAVNEQVNSREAQKQLQAPQAITNSAKTDMNSIASKIPGK